MPWRAALDRARGDFLDVRIDLAELARNGVDVAAFDEEARLMAGSPIETPLDSSHLLEREYLSLGQPIADSEFWQNMLPDCRLREGLDAAVTGDGESLAHRLGGCHPLRESQVWFDLLAVLPHVTSHRDEVAVALRRTREVGTMVDDPFALARQAARMRDTSRLAGDVRDAVSWAEIFARYDHVLSDRQKLLAYIAWQR
jgi:hypothetical protein